MIEEINKLISLLDENEDILLIELLKQKITKLNSNPYNFTNAQIASGKQGIKKMLQNYLIDNDIKLRKINKILEKQSNCIHCDLCLEVRGWNNGRRYVDWIPDDENKTCDSCQKRIIELEEFKELIKINHDVVIDEFIEKNNELLELKIIVNIISLKLSKYRDSKNKICN